MFISHQSFKRAPSRAICIGIKLLNNKRIINTTLHPSLSSPISTFLNIPAACSSSSSCGLFLSRQRLAYYIDDDSDSSPYHLYCQLFMNRTPVVLILERPKSELSPIWTTTFLSAEESRSIRLSSCCPIMARVCQGSFLSTKIPMYNM